MDLYRYITYIFSTITIITGGSPRLFDNKYGYILRVIGYTIILPYVFLFVENIFAKVLAISSCAIACIVSIYTANYAKHKYGLPYLQLIVDTFSLSIIFTFISKYLVEFIAFWLIAELVGFVLIAFEWFTQGNRNAFEAGVRYLLVSMVPADITLFALIALTGVEQAFTAEITRITPLIQGSPLITFLCVVGFIAKAAIAPLHFWLPDAHSIAPAPASSMLSGLMVKMGIYGLYLLTLYPSINTDVYAYTLVICGSITAIYGGLLALAQTDIKRILAYSTISHTSVMAILLGIYVRFNIVEALQAALFYIIAHAFFKASLFMDSGVVEIIAHTRDVGSLGYISRIYPLESIAALLAILSLIGVPPLPGFLAKFLTIFSMVNHLATALPIVVLLIVIAVEIVLSVGYGAKYLMTHFGSSTIKISVQRDIGLLKSLSIPIITVIGISIAYALSILLMQQIIYMNILSTIVAISSLFLMLIMYTIYKAQKSFRISESWLGGARP